MGECFDGFVRLNNHWFSSRIQFEKLNLFSCVVLDSPDARINDIVSLTIKLPSNRVKPSSSIGTPMESEPFSEDIQEQVLHVPTEEEMREDFRELLAKEGLTPRHFRDSSILEDEPLINLSDTDMNQDFYEGDIVRLVDFPDLKFEDIDMEIRSIDDVTWKVVKILESNDTYVLEPIDKNDTFEDPFQINSGDHSKLLIGNVPPDNIKFVDITEYLEFMDLSSAKITYIICSYVVSRVNEFEEIDILSLVT